MSTGDPEFGPSGLCVCGRGKTHAARRCDPGAAVMTKAFGDMQLMVFCGNQGLSPPVEPVLALSRASPGGFPDLTRKQVRVRNDRVDRGTL